MRATCWPPGRSGRRTRQFLRWRGTPASFGTRVRIGHRNLARDLDIALAAGHHIHVDLVGLVAGPIGRRLDRAEAHEIGRQRPEVNHVAQIAALRGAQRLRHGKAPGDQLARRVGVEGIVQRYGAGPRRAIHIVFAFAFARRHPSRRQPFAVLVCDLERELGSPGMHSQSEAQPLGQQRERGIVELPHVIRRITRAQPQRSLDIGRWRAQADLDFCSRRGGRCGVGVRPRQRGGQRQCDDGLPQRSSASSGGRTCSF